MAHLVSSLIAGIGLFFVGMSMLTEHLKILSGRKVRLLIARWTRNPLSGVLLGGLLIAFTQSTSATTFILISMIRSGMIKVRQTLPVIAGANIVIGFIVFLFAFDFKIVVFCLLGISGLVYTMKNTRKFHPAAGAVFGIGLLFLGLSTMQSGAEPLAHTEWFKHAIQWTQGHYFLAFVIGACLTLMVQASLAIVVVTIAFQQAGLFTLTDSMIIIYGANTGASLLTLILSSGLTGESKQVAMFQTAYNFIGAFIVIPAFIAEIGWGVPLVRALALEAGPNPANQIAIVNIVFNLLPGLILLALYSPGARILARFWPESPEEQASKPRYLHDQATEDPDTALDLIELEQTRMLELFSDAFNVMREQQDTHARLDALKDAFDTLSNTIRETINDLTAIHRLSLEAYNRLDMILNIQHSMEAAAAEIHGLGLEFHDLRQTEAGKRFASSAIEGLDFILMILADVAAKAEEEDAAMLSTMTSEDGNGIAAVRSAYLAEESGLDKSARMRLLAAANHCERLIWLFREIGAACMALKRKKEADG